MKKILLSILAIALMTTACNKKEKEICFSILGDSFTSYAGTVDPNTNHIWEPFVDIGVTSPDMMWFNQIALNTGWTLEKNNSFSGSHITNNHDYTDGDYYKTVSYLNRMDNLGTPDVIFVFGGTNDIYHRVPVGDYVYSDWSEEQLCYLRPAMAYMYQNMKRQYPKAKIYFMLDMELCISDQTIDDEFRQAYIESIHKISRHYNIECIDIYGIKKSQWHPNAKGQDTIAQQVMETLMIDFDIDNANGL